MARIEIHEVADRIRVDAVLPDRESSAETLEMIVALVDAVTRIGLETAYPGVADATLALSATARGCGYVVRDGDGSVVDADPESLSPLADRLENSQNDGFEVINP